MRICLFEDQRACYLEPLASTRPVFELLCGQTSLAAKQRGFFGSLPFGVLVRSQLSSLFRQDNPGVPVNDFSWLRAESVILVNGRWLPPPGALTDTAPHVALIGEEVVYAVLGEKQWRDCLPDSIEACLENWKDTLPHRNAPGVMICHPWDLVEHNYSQLRTDFQVHQEGQPTRIPEGVAIIGSRENLWIAPSARVEPMVVLDVSAGPVVIDREAVVTAFSRLEGPCYVGPKTQVIRGNVRGGCTFGPQCRVGGEVEASILLGHSNKYHEGFLGHSYVGEWVNLAAGTHNSDLRNDYGEVTVPLLGTSIKTGLSKVGCFIGDHTKTGLGTLLNTGSSIGIFSNLLPAGMLAPKYVPPFSTWWKGVLRETTDLNQLLTTAGKVMARRGQTLTEAHVTLYQQLFDETAFLRLRAMQDPERRRRAQSA